MLWQRCLFGIATMFRGYRFTPRSVIREVNEAQSSKHDPGYVRTR